MSLPETQGIGSGLGVTIEIRKGISAVAAINRQAGVSKAVHRPLIESPGDTLGTVVGQGFDEGEVELAGRKGEGEDKMAVVGGGR